MAIEDLKGSLLEAIRTSNDEGLLQDLKLRVDIEYYLKEKRIENILGGVDTDELIFQANEPDPPENSINEKDF